MLNGDSCLPFLVEEYVYVLKMVSNIMALDIWLLIEWKYQQVML